MNCRMLYVLCIILSFVSCHSEKKPNFEGLVKFDTLSLDIDYPYLSDYQCLTPVFYQDTLYAAGGNRFTNNIDLLNLSSGKHREIVVEREGPNGVKMPMIFCYGKEKFIVRQQERITVMDFNGKVIHKFPVEDLTSSNDSTRYRLRPFGSDLTGCTLIEAYNGKAFIPLTTQPTESTSCIGAVLDIEDAKFSLLPIYNPPEILSKRDELDAMAFPHIMPYQDRLVFSFPCSSKVYVYNRLSGQITDFKMNSLFVEDEIAVPAKLKGLRKIDFQLETPRYRGVHYSPNLHKYYRLVWGKNEWMGKMVENKDRTPSYLIVYDEDTGESKEYELPLILSSKQYIIYDDILYVAFWNETDDVFNFAKIDIATL